MRLGDYFRLGSISVRSRKKSSRNTVIGISFGLILLVPVLFLTLGAYSSLLREVNRYPTLSTITVESGNYTDGGERITAQFDPDGNLVREGLPAFADIQAVSQESSLAEQLVYNYLHLTGFSISIEGSPFFGANVSGLLRVCAPEQSGGKIVLDSELDVLATADTPLYAAGEGFDLSPGVMGKKQLVISQALLEKSPIPLPPDFVVGKRLSLRVSGMQSVHNGYLDDDTDPDNLFTPGSFANAPLEILTDFTVAGVISPAFFEQFTRVEDAQVWITSASLYYTNTAGEPESLAPAVNPLQDEGLSIPRYVATYRYPPDELRRIAGEQGVIIPYYPVVGYNKPIYSNLPVLKAYTTFQAKDFMRTPRLAQAVEQAMQPAFSGLNPAELSRFYRADAYKTFKMLYDVIVIAMSILYIFGGIIFAATVLNLYNSVTYSVQMRKHYIGVVRALGAKQRTIPLMYLIEICILFLYSLLFVPAISFGLCYGLNYGIDLLFAGRAVAYLPALTTNLAYFAPALLLPYAVSFLLALLISVAASFSVSRKPLLTVLSDETK